MLCGTRSFSQIHDEPPPMSRPRGCKLRQSCSMNKKKKKPSPPMSRPRGCKLRQSCSMNKKKKKPSHNNLYSTAGLDKFEKVLADLDTKKEKILLRAKSQGDVTVRFTYKPESEEWIPIVIKMKKPREENTKERRKPPPKAAKRLSAPPPMKIEESKPKTRKEKEVKINYGYWPLVIMLILVLLVFGRPLAICWTTMLWYLVPMVKGGGGRILKGKELGKRTSEKELGGVSDLRLTKGYFSGRR